MEDKKKLNQFKENIISKQSLKTIVGGNNNPLSFTDRRGNGNNPNMQSKR